MIIARTTSKMACKPGFFGTYCELHCPPGNFGEDCGGVCSPICPTSECDRVYGCSSINGNKIEASTKGPFKASNNSTMNPDFVTASEENMIFTKTRTTMEEVTLTNLLKRNMKKSMRVLKKRLEHWIVMKHQYLHAETCLLYTRILVRFLKQTAPALNVVWKNLTNL
uniref:Uncharacterized protein LOC111102404 isoform X2 n=1 Tax=Crassostrea virginica TaxID=6565 RepID=A0A8B8AL99_CRAVI|nr:uncharacterized protein LOC111102404 isoform X2 [Crassostrea virginica]